MRAGSGKWYCWLVLVVRIADWHPSLNATAFFFQKGLFSFRVKFIYFIWAFFYRTGLRGIQERYYWCLQCPPPPLVLPLFLELHYSYFKSTVVAARVAMLCNMRGYLATKILGWNGHIHSDNSLLV